MRRVNQNDDDTTSNLSSVSLDLPNKIYVSGLPLCWRGCNGWYHIKKTKDNGTIYRLPVHDYFGIIIRPVKIYCNHDYWKLKTDDFEGHYISRGLGSELLGELILQVRYFAY